MQIIKYKPRFTFILYGDFFCLYLIGHDQTFKRLDKKGGREGGHKQEVIWAAVVPMGAWVDC